MYWKYIPGAIVLLAKGDRGDVGLEVTNVVSEELKII